MTKYYQIVNFQHQPVRVFKNQPAAEGYIEELQKTYPDEGFYIVELAVVYSVGDIQ